ncbi:MAG: DUF3310 domain-containing protein [Chthoniobacterales bacterium]
MGEIKPKTAVNPGHYVGHKVAPIELIEAYDLNFASGNVIKYVARAKEKNWREDLVKALWYLLYELDMPQEEIRTITEGLNS